MSAVSAASNLLAVRSDSSWPAKCNAICIAPLFSRCIQETFVNVISLHSNLSDESLTLTPVAIGERSAAYDLAIHARVWDADDEHAVQLTAEAVTLSTQLIRHLASEVLDWVQSDASGAEPLVGMFDLSAEDTVVLRLGCADRADVVSSADRPTVTIEFRLGRLDGSFCFVTDQSCLNAFARGLRLSIEGVVGL